MWLKMRISVFSIHRELWLKVWLKIIIQNTQKNTAKDDIKPTFSLPSHPDCCISGVTALSLWSPGKITGPWVESGDTLATDYTPRQPAHKKRKKKKTIQYSLPLPPAKTLELMNNEQEGVVIWKESHKACHSHSYFHFTLQPSNDRTFGSAIILSCHHKIRYKTGTLVKTINLQSWLCSIQIHIYLYRYTNLYICRDICVHDIST